MTTPARSCPGCGSTNIDCEPADDTTTCDDCGFHATDLASWNRRTPGPATKAMMEWLRHCRDELSFGPSRNIARAFFDEWKGEDS